MSSLVVPGAPPATSTLPDERTVALWSNRAVDIRAAELQLARAWRSVATSTAEEGPVGSWSEFGPGPQAALASSNKMDGTVDAKERVMDCPWSEALPWQEGPCHVRA
ncbi:hypothetical protein [Pyxidicoccus xibeiensis]|uniref:hypothetical protein n=1 Tax=Pyxidicoccus xibeiensis TaxID=2906759 RepID=UPI0020A7F6BF|nr:hypothetical protein [Pyxidicoccus xibeiensis]MCP3142070.1 hypothetical protein [Pyxidicoccus xibeiensis]